MQGELARRPTKKSRPFGKWLLLISIVACSATLLQSSSYCLAKSPQKKSAPATSKKSVAKKNATLDSPKNGGQPKGQQTANRKPASASKAAKPPSGSPLRSIASDSEKALEVRGQSRNLSLMLVLKNNKESLDFVQPRNSFRKEIQNTNY